MRKFIQAVLYTILAAAAGNALAESIICGGTVIEDGRPDPVTADQVLEACGEPTTREPGQWVYAQPGEMTRILRFNSDGDLQSIEVEYNTGE